MAKYKCIYCLKEKEENEFNREHVVPRMMGTYIDGFVLNENQVCQECNSYFSKELEDKIGIDSYEAFLRLQHGKKMSDGRELRNKRISFIGNEGIYKGLKLIPVADGSKDVKFHFRIVPCIGIIQDEIKKEYSYYDIDSLPQASEDDVERIKKAVHPIIYFGIEKTNFETAIIEKGYIKGEFKFFESEISKEYGQNEFETKINLAFDEIVKRIMAKTVFNYLCYTKEKDYVLDSRFDGIRKFIRYGEVQSNLDFKISKGPLSVANRESNLSHTVGYMWHNIDGLQWALRGCLTWFGTVTYTFNLGVTDLKVKLINVMPCTKIACFNNENKTILEDEAVHLYQPK